MIRSFTRALIIAGGFTIAVLAVSCGGGDDGGGSLARPTEVVIDVTAEDMTFSPAEITVPAGKVVQLNLRNADGDTEHDLRAQTLLVEEIDQHTNNKHGDRALEVTAFGGTTRSVTFVASAPGRHVFVCTVEGHEAAGMVGTLVVE